MAKTARYWYIDRVEADTSLTPDASTAVIGLVEKGTSNVTRNGYSTDYSSISVAGTNNLRLYCICQDSDLSSGTLTGEFTNIPQQFHEVIVYKAISTGYKDPRNLELDNAQYFDAEYRLGIKEAKKFSRSNHQTTGVIRPQSF